MARGDAVAIVGIGCRFPGGADTPERFWNMLCEGAEAITDVPGERFEIAELFDPDPRAPGKLYARWGGFVDSIDEFDADFFGISPREARRIDPQHRLLAEVIWEALEDGGHAPDRLAGSSTGVFMGISTRDYLDIQMYPGNRDFIDAHSLTGGGMSIAANRISYLFDFHGPSLAIDTACSSSLTAIHLACRSLAAGDCDLAIAGGVNALLTPEGMIAACKAGMLSPDGRCKPFDARANGYVRSEGAGAVVLKTLDRALAHGDAIYSVIRATAVNQDGRTTGMTVPSAAAQEALLRRAIRDAGLTPSAVQYVEAHGTGTAVGDPQEAAALGKVFGDGGRRNRPCLVGSVKSNIGHLEAGAGIAGLIKTALALKHRLIPPTLHFTEANPTIRLQQLGLRIPTSLEPWPVEKEPAVAGVNSFGFGGANASAILEEPPPDRGATVTDDGRSHLLTLSARSPKALRAVVQRHLGFLDEHRSVSLRDLSHTTALRRSHHNHRVAVAASSVAELRDHLRAFLAAEPRAALAGGRPATVGPPKTAFVFSGMGPQWWGMGRGLMRDEPVFRRVLEECDRVLTPLAGWSLLDELAAEESESRVGEASIAHVANFALQVALAEVWRSWGLVPTAVVGHSSGEMAAACVAGALALPDALSLAFHRGRLQHRTTGSGGMLAVGVPLDEAVRITGGYERRVSVAASNAPSSVTLSGELDALEEIGDALKERGVFCRFLPVSVPYHGPQMDSLRDELLEELADLESRRPAIPIVSTATGAWMDGQPFDARYWWRNVREPVLFEAAIDVLVEDGCALFVELSPHPVLAPSIVECLAQHGLEGAVLPSLRRGEDDRTVMLRSLATLYVHGREVEWNGVLGSARGRVVPLPPYPWQRERHWLDHTDGDEASGRARGTDSGHPLLGRKLRSARPTWEVDLGDPRLGYLEGHVVQGVATFPAAAYVELELAAAQALRGDGRAVVEGVEFHRLLTISERGTCVLQCTGDRDERSLEIHSGTADGSDSWTLRARARLGDRPGDARAGVDLDALRTRCATAAPVDAYYRALEEDLRFRYEGAFRGIAELWRGRQEALARIELPGEVEASSAYQVHPAVLDAAFQVLFAALDAQAADVTDGTGPLVPVRIGRVELRRRPGTRCWSHASIDRLGDSTVEATVRLIDDDGTVALTCEGLVLKAFPRERLPFEDWLHQERWRPVPRDGARARRAEPVPSPADVAAEVGPVLEALAAECRLGEYYRVLEPALNAAATHHVGDGLRELGWDPDADAAVPVDDLADRHGVVPRHRRHFGRLLELASAAAAGPQDASSSLAALSRPDANAVVELVTKSGELLADTLRGVHDARQWMFTGETLEVLSDFYAGSAPRRVYNPAVAEAVASVQEACPSRKLSVLELGAGTGGTTRAVLPRLESDRCEFVFTDISPFFLARARDSFADRTGLRFEVLDIEGRPQVEGRAPSSFDVVIAADVLHATADLRQTLAHVRSLLAPGGLLVLLELTSRPAWLDLVFGQLDGWWRFADHDLRPSHPLLSLREWQGLLEEVGFTGVTSVSDGYGALDGEPAEALFLAQAPSSGATPAGAERPGRRRWLICADRAGVGSVVASALRDLGDRYTLVHPGSSYVRRGDDAVELRPASAVDWARLLDEHEVDEAPDGLIDLWSVDFAGSDRLHAKALMDAQEVCCGAVVSLLQALRQRGGALSEIWFVSAGAQLAGDDTAPPSLAQAPLWGLGRVVRNEQPGVRCRLVDLGSTCTPDEVDGLLDELDTDSPGTDEELVFRGRRRFARRIERASLGPAPPKQQQLSPDSSGFRLEIGSPGALETLALREVPIRRPGPGEVEIRLVAASLNFRDVLMALGMVQPNPGECLGHEGAGVVVACGAGVEGFEPGDEVIALLPWGGFGSRVVTRSELVAKKPANLTFGQAATLGNPFLTADYALRHLARLRAGERVLIHAASGGVGLSAVQIARRAGAHIFGTAGTPEKRVYLESLGLQDVLDSRSLSWADEILERTGGEGVDVVLNSLAGEAITKGLALLRPHGRFVELGRRDIEADARLGLSPFRNSLSFISMEIYQLGIDRLALLGSLLRSLVDDVARGALEPLPYTDFDLADAEQAFRHMAMARHIGRVVVTVREPLYAVDPPPETSVFRADATYLIAGGLGGFPLAVANWMVRRGARSLVLMSRSGAPKQEDEAAFRALTESPADVVVMQGDVSDKTDTARILERIRATMPPLRGIVHAAMVLDDDLLGRLDYDRFRAVLLPKVAGAWHLHELTLEDELELFVLFSSGSSLLGFPAQANYAAANAFLDSLAPYRRALGLPAVAINWGAIAGAGFVARHPEVERVLATMGVFGIAARDACAALEKILRSDVARVGVGRIDWKRWFSDPASSSERPALGPAGDAAPNGYEGRDPDGLLSRLAGSRPADRQILVEEYLVQRTAKTLAAAPEKIDPERPLTEMGLDSLMAVELQTGLRLDLAVHLEIIHLLDGISLRRLAGTVLEQLAVDGSGA